MLYYVGSNFVLFRNCFRAKDSPLFSIKFSATNQQWSLSLYTKHLMDMFPRIWIRRPSTFGKYSIFHPLPGFYITFNYTVSFFKTWKAIDSLTYVPNLLFSDVCSSLLFNFKTGPSLGLSCLMSSRFIIILINRIIMATCCNNTILMAELKGKLP